MLSLKRIETETNMTGMNKYYHLHKRFESYNVLYEHIEVYHHFITSIAAQLTLTQNSFQLFLLFHIIQYLSEILLKDHSIFVFLLQDM